MDLKRDKENWGQMTDNNEDQVNPDPPETVQLEGTSAQSNDGFPDSEKIKVASTPDAAVVKMLSDAEAAALSADVVKGSPFAAGTALPLDVVGQQIDFETGVWRETVLGGLFASFIMLVFSVPAIFFFPSGAVMISALGCLLGIMALASRRPLLALSATCANLIVLALGFGQSMF